MKFIEYQKRIEGTLAGRFYLRPIDADDIDRVLTARNCPSAMIHGNSRPVVIWGEVDTSIYDERVKNKGAQPITAKLFLSAKAASRHLGYAWDAVTQALLKAKARGEEIARVAGVPFRWADEIRWCGLTTGKMLQMECKRIQIMTNFHQKFFVAPNLVTEILAEGSPWEFLPTERELNRLEGHPEGTPGGWSFSMRR